MTFLSQQFVFDLTPKPAYDREDFLVSAANKEAFSLIETHSMWRGYGGLITGPRASGKTHLLHVWQAVTSAEMINHDQISDFIKVRENTPLPKYYALDGVDNLIGLRSSEEALFHLLNVVQSQDSYILMTALTPPANWNFTIKDLRSRIMSMQMAAIGLPDDELLHGLFAKLLYDRQLSVDPDVLNFTVMRLPRNCAAIIQAVERLDAASLSEKREITLPFVKKTLGL